MNHLGQVLVEEQDRPVNVLFVYNCNPLATMPNQEKVRRGLEREDLFTLVFEQFWTDTARYADLVLPATTFLEHREMSRGYGSMLMHRAEAVAAPAGEARPNYEVFGDLCRRLGLSRPGEPETAQELEAALLSRSERMRSELDRDDTALPDTGWAPVQFVDSFPLTPDRKAHLLPEALDREAPFGMYAYQEDPGGLLPSSRRPRAAPSAPTWGSLYRNLCPLEIHPDDAAASAGSRTATRSGSGTVSERCG